jgi:hypothetical protein
MTNSPEALLERLEATRNAYGRDDADAKILLLRGLERARLRSWRHVLRLHEHLMFLRACPDNPALRSQVEAMLEGFARRGDLRRHRAALADSGIAGTQIHYRFYWASARWLASRWPALLRIDWDKVEEPERLARALPLLATAIEAAWLRACNPAPKAAIERMCGSAATDGTFLVQRVAAMPGDDFTREAFSDALDTPFVLHPGPGTPSRTRARHARSPVAYVKQAPVRERPDLLAELKRPPRSVRAVSAVTGAALIDLARAAVVTRARDLDAFAYGNRRDVLLVDDGAGLQWALIGMIPERRAVLRASYGFLTLRSGAPVGYGQFDVLFGCVDLSFNTFDTFRGGDTARVFARVLAACRRVFRATSFTLEPYQLGSENDEAIASGAWWFYYKLGFRPRDAAIKKLAAFELARMSANPGHRSSAATLKRLAQGYLQFETGRARAPDWPRLAGAGEKCAARLAAMRGLSRAAAVHECSRRALQLLGLRDLRLSGPDARLAWERWAPLVALLPAERWSLGERLALTQVILAKGRRSEINYLELFDAHPRLGRALRHMLGV